MADTQIFISYAREDNDYKVDFLKYLKNQIKAEKKDWTIWTDDAIALGDKWDDAIKKSLTDSAAVICLVSVDFLNSTYINDVELRQALDRDKKNEAVMIPVIVRHEETWLEFFGDINGIDIAADILKNKDLAYGNAAKRVVAGISKFLEKKPLATQPTTAADLAAFRKLDPEALLLVVRGGKKITLLAPGNDAGQEYKLSEGRFEQKILGILQRLLVKGGLDDDDCQTLGLALFQRLLPEPAARETFLKIYREHKKSSKPGDEHPLKIILHFDADSRAVASLPWEYLWLPLGPGEDDGVFLGAEEHFTLTRRLDAATEKSADMAASSLRIFIALPKPPGDKSADDVAKKLAEEIEKNAPARFDIEWKSPVVAQADFLKILKEKGPFHVVHFIGKGKTERQKDGSETHFIAFFDEKTGVEKWLTTSDFAKIFEASGKPALLFLHPLDDEESRQTLRKMALDLVGQLDGVMAIQTSVQGNEAHVFSKKLYQAMQNGQDLDTAAACAARQLVEENKQHLRMYGISASFSRKTLRVVMEKEKEPDPLPCPNHLNTPPCPKMVQISADGSCKNVFCIGCDAGPLMICPSCLASGKGRNLIALDPSRKRCPICGGFMSEILEKASSELQKLAGYTPASAGGVSDSPVSGGAKIGVSGAPQASESRSKPGGGKR